MTDSSMPARLPDRSSSPTADPGRELSPKARSVAVAVIDDFAVDRAGIVSYFAGSEIEVRAELGSGCVDLPVAGGAQGWALPGLVRGRRLRLPAPRAPGRGRGWLGPVVRRACDGYPNPSRPAGSVPAMDTRIHRARRA